MNRPQARITVRDTHERIRAGHPWVFGNQVVSMDGEPTPGDVVRVYDDRRRPLGQGYWNPASLITVRLLTQQIDDRVDAAFIRERIARACAFRKRMGYTSSYRVIFGEADLLPGLVADLFHDVRTDQRVLSIQFLTLGMERWRDIVIDAFQELLRPTGIYLRNDVPIREKEGLQQEKGPLGTPFTTDMIIREGADVLMHVDVAGGQKTGHFLDQVVNHVEVGRMCAGQRVLDCFTHTGGFALHAARSGAASVEGLDISKDAVLQASRNAELNGLTNCTFREANVFDELTAASRTGGQWDVIVLDPPAFAKSRGAMENAYRGYKEINLRAMKCLPKGGLLVTCSCSQHMGPELFRRMVAEAAQDAGRRLREVYYGTQPPDHPILWGVPETHYLKCLVLEVL